MAASQDCLFCGIVRGQTPCKKAYEDERVLAFWDIRPQAPTHVLLVPKRHLAGVQDATESDAAVAGELLLTAARLARELGIHEAGYRLVINAGPNGGQTVDHLHVHLLGGRQMRWPPG